MKHFSNEVLEAIELLKSHKVTCKDLREHGIAEADSDGDGSDPNDPPTKP